ncbi:flagellar transcriptional regulator FlhD [Bordetella sp. 15P40C-2]|uniref:flagellar transcriptional regulator FlhD n=1 Tax=Bordetella sp. 15P40C-2 TaxID=2572246 RepID=UPI00132344BF|nr:flagellar transcriptional regulator FlhD [Bordetella sp. 15P40C-2]MVW70030.1 flagellar transcriptional regulator FlhD [Bordetella sp. 15P40C-2]
MAHHSGCDDTALSEIRDVNLNYLILAQRLLREDFATGLFRTGLSEETGRIVLQLSLQQVVALASTTALLCGFRLNDASLLSALSKSGMNGALQQARMTMALTQAPTMPLQSVTV